METIILPILIAAAVSMAVFGLMRVIAAPARSEKKKLANRLSTDRPYDEPQSPSARPITLLTDTQGLPPMLARFAAVRRLNRRLGLAYPRTKPVKFLLIAAGAAVGLFLLSFLFTGGALLVSVLAGAFAGYVPFFVLKSKVAKRQRLLADQLPEGLEFLSRILQAGHSFSTGLQMMADELPKPLADEFRRAYDQHSLGQSVEDALKDMTTRIESPDFAFFITAVLIQRQTGGELSEVLKNISGMIRGRIRLQQNVKAKTAEGRFTGYVMVAFPLVMFFIAYWLNPDLTGVLLTTSTGRWMLGVAGFFQILGLFAIKKITTVTV